METYADWLAQGEGRGWVSRFCAMHDPFPRLDALQPDLEAGLDPCIPAVVLLPEVTP